MMKETLDPTTIKDVSDEARKNKIGIAGAQVSDKTTSVVPTIMETAEKTVQSKILTEDADNQKVASRKIT